MFRQLGWVHCQQLLQSVLATKHGDGATLIGHSTQEAMIRQLCAPLACLIVVHSGSLVWAKKFRLSHPETESDFLPWMLPALLPLCPCWTLISRRTPDAGRPLRTCGALHSSKANVTLMSQSSLRTRRAGCATGAILSRATIYAIPSVDSGTPISSVTPIAARPFIPSILSRMTHGSLIPLTALLRCMPLRTGGAGSPRGPGGPGGPGLSQQLCLVSRQGSHLLMPNEPDIDPLTYWVTRLGPLRVREPCESQQLLPQSAPTVLYFLATVP